MDQEKLLHEIAQEWVLSKKDDRAMIILTHNGDDCHVSVTGCNLTLIGDLASACVDHDSELGGLINQAIAVIVADKFKG